MTRPTRFSTFMIMSILSVFTLYAQVSEDAYRFSSFGLGGGTRALGMGNAYIGVSDDFTAVVWNPAGLAQMRRLEFTGGIAQHEYYNTATFLGTSKKETGSSTSLDNLGFVFPFPTIRGSLVFAFGYNRVTNFTTALSYDGYNAASSIIPWLYNGDVDYDLAYKTKLNNYYGYTPIQNRVQQRGDVRESGGLGNWAFSGAIDVEENISFGMTLNVISGEYNYVRNYIEEDLRNVYNDLLAPADSVYLRFNRFYYDTDVSAELNGVNILFGMMYRMNDQLRCGVTIKSPSMISVRESALDEGTSFFDKGETTKGTIEYKNDYGVSSSWVFGAGASFYTVDWILISGDVEYTDWSQLEWTDNAELEKDNILLKKLFRPVYNVRFGIELEIPSTDLRVRAGAILNQSPFAGDPAKYDTRMETFGLGMLLQNNVLVDLAVAYGQMEIYHNNYGTSRLNLSRTDEKITTADVKFSIAYRF